MYIFPPHKETCSWNVVGSSVKGEEKVSENKPSSLASCNEKCNTSGGLSLDLYCDLTGVTS